MEKKTLSDPPSPPLMPEKKKLKILGLGIEAWLLIFVVVAAIPLLNMFVLPAVFFVFAAGVAGYVLWRMFHAT